MTTGEQSRAMQRKEAHYTDVLHAATALHAATVLQPSNPGSRNFRGAVHSA